jgi:undecaprenyl-diphosphatase
MFIGIEREQIVRYSFLLSIPAILGAATIEPLLEQDQSRTENMHIIGIESYVIGTVISAIVGYVSIRILVRLIIRVKFYIFAFYCFTIGMTTYFLL